MKFITSIIKLRCTIFSKTLTKNLINVIITMSIFAIFFKLTTSVLIKYDVLSDYVVNKCSHLRNKNTVLRTEIENKNNKNSNKSYWDK